MYVGTWTVGSAIPRHVGLGCIRKVSKPVSSVPPGSAPALPSLDDSQRWTDEANKPSFLQVGFGHWFVG